MSQPIDLDGPPACPECGAPMTVTEWPGKADDGASMWSADCPNNYDPKNYETPHGEIVDRMARPTWRTEPGCAALVAEIDRLRAETSRVRKEYLHLDRQHRLIVDEFEAEIGSMRIERQAILDAGGDFLWAGGAKTLPEAVAGALHALDVALTRSAEEYDASPAAKVRHDHPHVKVTDADLVESAVRTAGRCGPRMARWAAVKDAFVHGAGVSTSLCRACGLDPDEMVGDDGEGEE